MTTAVTFQPLDSVSILTLDPETGLRHRIAVAGERTNTPGLVIGHALTEGDLWHVVHESSGLRLRVTPRIGVDIELARRIAKALGSFDIDWTADLEEVLAALNIGDIAAQIRDTIRRLLAGEREEERWATEA